MQKSDHHRTMDREQLSKLRSLVEEGLSRTNLYIYMLDPEGRFLYISPSAARSIGRPPEEIIGRTGRDLGLPEDIVTTIERTVQGIIDGGRTVHGELTGRFMDQDFVFEYDATPLSEDGDHYAVMALVIDRSLERRGHALLEALNDINLQISGLADPDAIMTKVVDLAGAAMGGDPLALVLRDGGEWTIHYIHALPPQVIGQHLEWAEELVGVLSDPDAPWVIDDAPNEPRLDQEAVRRFDARSILSVPVRIKSELTGCIIFLRQGSVRPYSKDEVEFGRKLANSVSVALSSSALYQEMKRSDEEKAALLVQLAEEKEVLRAMMEVAPVVMALFEGEEPRLIMGNAAYCNSVRPIGGGPPVGRYLKDMVDEEEYRQDMELVRRVRATGRPVVNEEYVRHPPGGPTQYCQISLLPLEQAAPRRVLMVSSNVTKAMQDKQRIEELAQKADGERKRLRAILDTMPVGVVVVDSEGNVLESNELRDHIWGGKVSKESVTTGPQALRGRWADTGLSMAASDWPVNRALRNGERSLGLMVDIQRLDGSQGTTLVSAAPIVNDAGERIGAVGVLQDITDQRWLEHEAVEAKERAELYIDLLTHDVNNINTAISSYIQLAAGEQRDRKRSDCLALALESVAESTKLIDNVQKLQRVEASEGARSLIDLGLTIEDVIDEQLERPDNSARIEHRPQLKRFVLATDLLKDVFINLIGNAAKHAGRPVTIQIALFKAFEGGREFHKVVIEDDGPGIEDEVKGKVFVRQFRGTNRSKGSGLGLYLVKKLVEDYGGRVWVEDRIPGEHAMGAKFVVMLPAAAILLRER